MKRSSGVRFTHDLIALAVLALLVEQPCHPYEMQRLMRERHIDFAIGKTRSFYDAVDRLLRHGLVEQGETSRAGRHPERTVYRITAEGREEFESWLTDLLSTPVTEYPVFTVAVSFLAYFPPAVAAATLRVRAAALEGQIAGLDAVLRAFHEEVRLPRVVLLEHEHTRALRQAELTWLRSLVDDLESGRLTWDRHLGNALDGVGGLAPGQGSAVGNDMGAAVTLASNGGEV
jgi:DNA-binding PadR family transcriptional regulator